MPDTTAPEAPPVLHWKTRQKMEREAAGAVNPSASSEAPPAPTVPQPSPASEPASRTWEQFQIECPWRDHFEKVLEHGLSDKAAFNIAQYGEGKRNGLLGKIQSLYRAKFMCWREGPSPIGPGGIDFSVDPDAEAAE
jgi:hypothetical protein